MMKQGWRGNKTTELLIGYHSVLVSYHCCNEVPYIQWLKNNTNLLPYSSKPVLEE